MLNTLKARVALILALATTVVIGAIIAPASTVSASSPTTATSPTTKVLDHLIVSEQMLKDTGSTKLVFYTPDKQLVARTVQTAGTTVAVQITTGPIDTVVSVREIPPDFSTVAEMRALAAAYSSANAWKDLAVLSAPDLGTKREVRVVKDPQGKPTGKFVVATALKHLSSTTQVISPTATTSSTILTSGAFDIFTGSSGQTHCGFIRYGANESDPAANYSMDKLKCSGYGDDHHPITRIRATNDYGAIDALQIVDWEPFQADNVGQCTTRTQSVGTMIKGVSFGSSNSVPHCPNVVYPEYNKWKDAMGNWKGPDCDNASCAKAVWEMSIVRVLTGHHTGLQFVGEVWYHWTFT